MADNAGLEGEQLDDFRQNVCRHLEFLPGEDPVNPREIKRLINAYTLQLKMLSKGLGDRLDPNIVMALQVMSFRRDWRYLYDYLAADPTLFQSILREALIPTLPPDALWLSGSRVAITAQFVEYAIGLAQPLVNSPDLPLYVSAAESTRSSDPSLLEAQIVVNRLRQSSTELAEGDLPPADAASKIAADFKRLGSVLPSWLPVHRTLDSLYQATEELTASNPRAPMRAPRRHGGGPRKPPRSLTYSTVPYGRRVARPTSGSRVIPDRRRPRTRITGEHASCHSSTVSRFRATLNRRSMWPCGSSSVARDVAFS